jgi:hypothetical protein
MKIIDRWTIEGRGIVLGIDALPAELVEGMSVRRVAPDLRSGVIEPTWRVVGIETLAMPRSHTNGKVAGLLLAGSTPLPEVGTEIEIVAEEFQTKPGRPWLDNGKLVPELHSGGWEYDLRVCIGTTNVVEIDKFYGPLVAQPVRVSLDGEMWVVERMVDTEDPEPGTSTWVEVARFPIDGEIPWMVRLGVIQYRERVERKQRSQLMWERVASEVHEFDVAILGTRYGGVYEGGNWIAWVGDLDWLDDYQAGDLACQAFFEDYSDAPIGRGETPQAALDDLRRRVAQGQP